MNDSTDRAAAFVAERLYDSGTTLCGELAIALRAELGQLPAGGVLEVVARDSAAIADLPAWCEVTGHELLGAAPPRFWIRRRPDPVEPTPTEGLS
ncbi:MAG: sulfurtransferase TusA family protein [Planctomycetes bacterium]|nr:sulfurtransferase TusA family protein [Planctomycetota bacterium]MCB9885479.1 sulfurtransferase TusA family protein [Planctomycetota bacterium]